MAKEKTVRQQEVDAAVLRSGRFVYSAKRANRKERRAINAEIRNEARRPRLEAGLIFPPEPNYCQELLAA